MNFTTNPYHPPESEATGDSSIVPSRESLVELIQSFLNSEITAFALDQRLDEYRGSDDPIVSHVVEAIWYHYDDCVDHLVCFSKLEWDYFQRLLLILSSDSLI